MAIGSQSCNCTATNRRNWLPAEVAQRIHASFWQVIRDATTPGGWPPFHDDISLACELAGARPDAVLVDAVLRPDSYGGTGHAPCRLAQIWPNHSRLLGDVPLILAGGLTPENVAEAIRIVRPQAVDVASGVEAAPGKKDNAKMRDFVAAAKAAFAAL